MVCPPVRGDNPRALASGLFCVQVDKHGLTILYHLHQCRPCTSRDIYAKIGEGGINLQIPHRISDLEKPDGYGINSYIQKHAPFGG